MILVVADTTPLRYLVEIAYDYLLPKLFTKVWIPGAVAGELRHERAPVIVRDWAERLPSWYGSGEWEAIELAKELQANLLLIDERSGVLISIEEALARLSKTNLRRTPELFSQTQKLVRQFGTS